MRLSDFHRNSTTLEIKYDENFLIWDRVGEFWNEMKRNHSGLKLQNVKDIGSTHFVLGKDAEIIITVGSLTISWYNLESSRQEEFNNFCHDMIATAEEHFKLDAYKRIGYKTVFFKQSTSSEEANNDFFSLDLIKVPNERHFNIDGKKASPEYKMGFESDTLGFTIKIHPIKTEVNVDIPFNLAGFVDVSSGNYKRFGNIIDVDYYTVVTVAASQLNIREWLEQSTRAIKRDMHVYLGHS